jgi:hypothetical protein
MTPKSEPDEMLGAEYPEESAPLDDAPLSAEDREAIDRARAQYDRDGITISGPQVSALLNARSHRR